MRVNSAIDADATYKAFLMIDHRTLKECGRITGQVSVHDLVDLKDPHANVLIRPRDQISVSRAKVLNVIGNVK